MEAKRKANEDAAAALALADEHASKRLQSRCWEAWRKAHAARRLRLAELASSERLGVHARQKAPVKPGAHEALALRPPRQPEVESAQVAAPLAAQPMAASGQRRT